MINIHVHVLAATPLPHSYDIIPPQESTTMYGNRFTH